ncbi:RHS repeat-associated core domain-containing protein [Amorphoplanes digitatis]|uniref:RHS repeat-associated core domain-containing protein n=1 Tax=Actinoplanes digitatis TaxID=1868 RepID=UPI0019429D19|nr:RHS repeat-associated core domain-containing protein [Actinoplanes digitatis]
MAGSKTSTYVYDADGNRLVAKDSAGFTVYLPGGIELRSPASGTATATHYYAHLDIPIAVRTAAGLSLLVNDHHDTGEVQLSSTTLAMERRRTLPFGELRTAASGWRGDHAFLNGRSDETGLTHLGAREYDPTLGRFISVDPIIDHSDPQQLNGYSYSNNNPSTLTDPTGLRFPEETGLEYTQRTQQRAAKQQKEKASRKYPVSKKTSSGGRTFLWNPMLKMSTAEIDDRAKVINHMTWWLLGAKWALNEHDRGSETFYQIDEITRGCAAPVTWPPSATSWPR